jgi:hypothetical protein
MQSQRFVEVLNGFLSRITETRHVHNQTLGNEVVAFLPNNTF